MFSFIRTILAPFVPKLNEDKSNLGAFYQPVSELENQSFCLNYGGYPRNDINIFLEAESLQVAEALSRNLIERAADGVSANVPNADLLLSAKSKYQQTPSELIGFFERQLSIRDDKALAKQQEIDFEKSLSEKEALRKSINDSLTSEERDAYIKAKRQKDINKLLED